MANAKEKNVVKAALRLIFGFQACENYEREQAYDFLYCMLPTLKETYKDDKEELKKRLKAHNTFFNCNPIFTGPIVGLACAMEENKVDSETIQALKVGLMGPLAGVGDTLVFTVYISILFAIGASLAQAGSIAGPLLVIPFTFIPLFIARYFGTIYAYRKGMESIDVIMQKINSVTVLAQKFGCIIIGAMVVFLVICTTKITVPVGETTLNVQEKLNTVLPNLLQILVVFLCYKLLTKYKFSPIKVLFVLLILGFVLGALGIL